jgi:Cu-Zn family superoxide dismutase
MKRLVSLAVPLLLIACVTKPVPKESGTATLAPTSGNTAAGTVTFRDLGNGKVMVDAKLTGVPPGIHGFHVHELGACGDNGNAAGPHFNASSAAHGAPSSLAHHNGDFGNVEADTNGNVTVSREVTGVTVSSGALSVVGRAVILHANPDDFVTQPTGNAGARIACGVVVADSMQQ